MEGKTNEHFDGIFQKLKESEIQRKVRRFGVLGIAFFMFAAIISNSVFPQTILGETGSASANRLWSSGAELNTTTSDVEVTGTSGTISISSSTKRSGDYAYRANPTSSTGTFYKTWAASAQTNKFWFRQYIRIATAPGGDTYIMQIGNGGSGKISVRLTSSSTLQLRNEEDNANIGSASSALSTNTWYRVEVFIDTTTISSTDATLLLDGVSIASSTAENLAAGVDRWTWGVANSTTADIFFDDLALNDSTARSANNWPGEGKIIHMQANATGSNSAWTNDYSSINASTWTNDSTTIYTTTNNAIEDVNLESSSSAGIGANDKIKLVSVGLRVKLCGSGGGPSCPAGFGGDLNYATRITAGGSTDETQVGIDDTNVDVWYTNDDDQPKLNATTSYDLPGSSTAPWTPSDLDSTEIGIKNYDSTGVGYETSLMWLQVEYVDLSGGRLFSSGFELQSTTAGMEYTANIGTTPTVNTTSQRSGGAALRTNASSGTSGWEYDFASANTAADYYYRSYIRVATAPGTLINIMEFYDSANTVQASIRMNTNRTLELWNSEDSVQIGSDSTAVALTTWTRLEIRLNCASTCAGAGTATLDARLNGSSFASSSTINHANGIMTVRGGVLTTTTADFSWDDVALNRAIGTNQNSWPGEGKIIHLRPNADDATNTAWTNGYANVDEITPNDATDLVSETTSGDIDDYDLDASTIGATDTVNLVSVGVRFRTSSATQEDFRVRLKDSASGIAIESNTLSPASTTWATNATAAPRISPLIAYTRPEQSTSWTDAILDTSQVGVRDVLSGSGTVQVSALWLLVEYVPSTTISISGTCDAYDQTTDCTDDGGNSIAVAVNGTLQGQSDTVVDGAWSITGVTQPSTNDIITVFINGETTDSEEAVAVTKYDGSGNITGIVLFHRHLTIGSADNQTLSNADIDAYDNSISSDEDIFFDVSAGNDLTVDSLGSYTDEELYIVAGNTYRPASGGGADVTTVHVENDGTWTADSNAITVNGSWQNDGTFTAGTSTVTFNSTSTGRTLSGAMTGGSAFNNIIFNGVSGGWTLGAAMATTNFDITNGTFDNSSGNNYAVTVSNNLTGNSGTWTLEQRASTWTISGNWDTSAVAQDSLPISEGTSTVIMNGSGTKTIKTGTTNSWEPRFYNLQVGQSGNTTQLLSSTAFSGVLTLGTGTIDLNSNTFFVASSITNPLSLTGTFGTGNGTLYFAAGSVTVNLPSYTYNSDILNSIASTGTLSFQGATTITGALRTSDCCSRANTTDLNGHTVTVNGNVTIEQSVASLTLDSSTLNVGGDWVNTVGGTVNAGTSTVNFTKTSGTQTVTTGGVGSTKRFYDLTHSGAATLSLATNDVEIQDDLLNTGGPISGSVSVTVGGNTTGTGAITMSGGTFEQRPNDVSKNFGTTSGTSVWTFNNLTFSDSCSGVCAGSNITITTQTGGTGGVTVSGVLKLSNATDQEAIDLNAGNRTWTLSGTGGDPFQITSSPAASLVASTSTFTFTGNNGGGNTVVQDTTYNNLVINNGAETYVLEGTTTVGNDLTITAGVLDVTVSDHGLSIAGDYANSGTLTARTGTVTLNGSSTQTLTGTMTGGSAFSGLTIANSSGTVSGCSTSFTAGVSFGASATFSTYTISTAALGSGVYVEYNSGSTYAVSNISWTGTVGKNIYFRNSNLASGTWLLNYTPGTQSVSYVDVGRSDASSGTQINASNGTNTNCNNNTNWLFNSAPDAPTSLVQKRVTAGTTMNTGDWTNETQVLFEATATDADNPDTLQLCVETDILGTGFSNTEDLCGSGVAYSGSGVTVAVTVTGLTDASEYHWQARVKDAAGDYSSWVSFGANGESARDYGIDSTPCTYSGVIYDGSSEDVDINYNDGSLTNISANWDTFNCSISGLSKYEYSIGTSAGGTDTKSWTDLGTSESVSVTSLTLRTNKSYFFNIRATDNASNVSNVFSSDGQSVLPTISARLGSGTITFSNLNSDNNRSDIKSLKTITSTNGYGGYVIRQYAAGLLSSGVFTIPMFSAGSYESPASWSGGPCSGTTCGYGYTSSDSSIQGKNKFGNGTLFAPFSLLAFGDIVADHTETVDGSTGPVINEEFTITHKVSVSDQQESKSYSTSVYYIVTGTF